MKPQKPVASCEENKDVQENSSGPPKDDNSGNTKTLLAFAAVLGIGGVVSIAQIYCLFCLSFVFVIPLGLLSF